MDSLTEADMATLFREFDDNNSGTITRHEFKAAFRGAGVEGSDEFYDSLFEKADEDATGEVNFSEFVEMCHKMQLARRGLTAGAITGSHHRSEGGTINRTRTRNSTTSDHMTKDTSVRVIKSIAHRYSNSFSSVAPTSTQELPSNEKLQSMRSVLLQLKGEIQTMINAIDTQTIE